MQKRSKVTLKLILLGGFFCAVAQGAEILWQDDCESTRPWRTGPKIQLAVEARDAYMTEGQGGLHIMCPRKPGMKDTGFSGWYWIERNVTPFKIREGDTLNLKYMLDQIEEYYPPLYFILIDEDGKRRHYSVGTFEKGRWQDISVALSKGGYGRTPVEEFGIVNKIHIAFYYDWFREFRTYNRWIDDIQIIRGGFEKSKAPGKTGMDSTIRIKKTSPVWPVVFVPYKKDVKIDGELAEVAGTAPFGVSDSKQYIPTIFGTCVAWDGADDFSAKLWSAWNEDGLYLGLRVKDDSTKCNALIEKDFRDSDNWRIYFDMGREVFTTGDKTNDRTDYIYAATPTSPENIPLLRYINFGGYYHQINDEGRLFDVGSIKKGASLREKGWDMELFFPAELMRGFKAEENRSFVFGSMWGDTDVTGRETEMSWPRPDPQDASYYYNFANFADMVLLCKNGAFGYRMTKAKVNRHEPWQLKVYGVAGSGTTEPEVFDLQVTATDVGGKVVRKWNAPIKLGSSPQWYNVDLSTTGLGGGSYKLSLSLHRGKVVLKTQSVDVSMTTLSKGDFEKKIQNDLAEIKQYRNVLSQKIASLQQKGYQVNYLISSQEVLDLFVHALSHPLGDIKKKKYASVLRQLKELKQVAEQAILEADNPEKYAGKWRAIPKEIYSDDTPPEIREGMFWHHGRPIFMEGWIGMDTTRGSAARIKRLGYNSVQEDHVLSRVIGDSVDEGTFKEKERKHWQAMYDRMMKQGLYIPHVMPIIAGVPDWVKKDPKMNRCSGHFLPFCLEAEDTYRMIGTYFSKFLPFFADKPNMLSFCVINEQEYEAGCEDAIRMYRQWLKDRYKNIGKLNMLWRTKYKSFDDIPRTKTHKSQGAQFDWILFNRHRLNDASRRIINLAKKHDPLKRPVHTKPMTHFWRNQSEVYGGVDREALTEMSDFTGFDGSLHSRPIVADYLKSLDRDKLFYNSEGHGTYDHGSGNIYRRVWEGAIHGVAANTRWLWDWPWGGWAANNEGYPLRQPIGLATSARASMDIQRLAPEIHAINRTPGQIAILDSLASRAFDFDDHRPVMHELYDTLHSCQTPVRFITEKQLRNGLYKKFRIIMVPEEKYIEADLIAPLQQFVKEGGKLLLIGDCFKLDQYGREINVPAELQSNTLAISSASWTDKDKRLQYFDKLLTKAGVQRPVRVEDGNGKLVDGIEVLWAVKDERPIVFLASFSENPQPVELTLKWNGQKTGGLDLITNEPVEETFRLKPFGVKLLDLSKK